MEKKEVVSKEQKEEKKEAPMKQEQIGKTPRRDTKRGNKGKGKRDMRRGEKKVLDVDAWKPKTGLGLKVKNKEITTIDEILDKGLNIMEAEITEMLMPNLEMELLMVGQSKGKFGGGARRVFKQTQKKTMEGNKPKFLTVAVVGNGNGYVGIGFGKSKETVPAREKATRNAKMNIFKIRRGCGSWQCGCKEGHTLPFKTMGKCSSVVVELIPAPKGTGIKTESECQKILRLAGVKDVWSRTKGQVKSKLNVIKACEMALKQLMAAKVGSREEERLGMIEGKQESVEQEVIPVEVENDE